ncbi:hypothetical protein ACFL03_15460 [Thermodesulfobacteriota bacterium]
MNHQYGSDDIHDRREPGVSFRTEVPHPKDAPNRRGAVILGGSFIVLTMARNLAKHGVRVCVLNPGICEARFSRDVSLFLKCPPWENEEALVEYLLKVAEQRCLRGWVLFATSDPYLRILSRHRSVLAGHYVVAVHRWDTVKPLYDKRRTYSLARRLGISIPDTYRPKSLDELLSLDIDFPVVLKPAISHRLWPITKRKAYRVDHRKGLRTIYERMCQIIDPSEILVQDFIPGGTANLFSFAGYFKGGKPLAGLSAKRSRQFPVEFGEFSTFVEAVNIPELKAHATRLLRSIGYTGLAEVEFMWHEKHARFELLEVNARPWAWDGLAIAAGLDLPYLAFADALGYKVPIGSTRDTAKWVYLPADLLAASSEIYSGKLTVRQYLGSLRGNLAFAVYSFADPLLFIAEPFLLLLWTLRRLIPKKGRVEVAPKQ